MPAHTKTFDEQFWPKVEMDPNSGCWLWNAAIDSGGYSVIQFKQRTLNAHRVGYEQLIGQIPDDLDLDHKCRTRCCVNPSHLEPVTPLENVRRSPIHVGARTHCPAGHEYTPENTRRYKGERACRVCARDQQRTPEARAKQASYRAENREKNIEYQRRYRQRSKGVS